MATSNRDAAKTMMTGASVLNWKNEVRADVARSAGEPFGMPPNERAFMPKSSWKIDKDPASVPQVIEFATNDGDPYLIRLSVDGRTTEVAVLSTDTASTIALFVAEALGEGYEADGCYVRQKPGARVRGRVEVERVDLETGIAVAGRGLVAHGPLPPMMVDGSACPSGRVTPPPQAAESDADLRARIVEARRRGVSVSIHNLRDVAEEIARSSALLYDEALVALSTIVNSPVSFMDVAASNWAHAFRDCNPLTATGAALDRLAPLWVVGRRKGDAGPSRKVAPLRGARLDNPGGIPTPSPEPTDEERIQQAILDRRGLDLGVPQREGEPLTSYAARLDRAEPGIVLRRAARSAPPQRVVAIGVALEGGMLSMPIVRALLVALDAVDGLPRGRATVQRGVDAFRRASGTTGPLWLREAMERAVGAPPVPVPVEPRVTRASGSAWSEVRDAAARGVTRS